MAALGNRATGDQGENIGICGQIIIGAILGNQAANICWVWEDL